MTDPDQQPTEQTAPAQSEAARSEVAQSEAAKSDAAPRKRPILPYMCLTASMLSLIAGPLFFIALFMKPPATEDVTLIVPRGSSVQAITRLLDEQDLLVHPLLFRIASRWMANDTLKAGEYTIASSTHVIDLTKMLRDGTTVMRQMTFAEGLSSYEILALIEANPALTGVVDPPPAEGSLLPESYRYSYGDSRNSLVQRMQRAQQEQLEKLWAARQDNLPLRTIEEALVLASIVEKETGQKAQERGLAASVFINRLRRGMPLQSDPTVIYAMTLGKGGLGRPLLRKDLSIESPWNTYRNAGLPPSPICNPGRAAIEAVLQPPQTDYLYFVADGTGGHAFARTLKEHNENVAKWQRFRRNNP